MILPFATPPPLPNPVFDEKGHYKFWLSDTVEVKPFPFPHGGGTSRDPALH
jgi:hypothetical protein